MKTIKSIIKIIDRFIPFKETGFTLLGTFILLILIEYIWNGSVSHLLNMNHVIVAVIILAYLIAVAIIIKYIRRYLRIRQNNIQRLRARMLGSEDQAWQTEKARILRKTVSMLLLILPSILLALIAVETVWEGSVSYYINLNYLIIGVIVSESIAILVILIILFRPLSHIRGISTVRIKSRVQIRRKATFREPLPVERKHRLKQTGYTLFLILLVAILITLAVGSIWEDSIPDQINQLRIAAVVLAVIAVWTKKGRFNAGLLFISSITFLALPQLIKIVMYFETSPMASVRVNDFINTFSPIAIATGALAGIIYVHHNRDKITDIFEKTENAEDISKGRSLLYKLPPLILVLLGLALTLPGLGSFDFREDEYQVIGSAAGYYHTGHFYTWDWLTNVPSGVSYERAWPHTFMVAMSYHLFGISEWSSRIVSVFWFVVLILAAYFITKKVMNRNIAFLFAVIAAMYTSYLFYARYTRMYIVFIPVFFIAAYFLYRGIFTGKPHTRFRIISGLRLNYLYLITGGLVFYFSYLIHLNTIIYIFGFFIFMIVWMFKNKYWAYLKPGGVMTIFAIALLFILLLTDINIPGRAYVGLPDTPGYNYMTYLFQYPFGLGITVILLVTGIPIFWKKPFLIYSFILPVSALILFTFFTTRYTGWVYISNFTPFVILLAAVCIYYLTTVFFKEKRRYKYTLVAISIFIIISSFSLEVPKIYGESSEFGHYKEAYKVINENYTEGEVIIGQYLRTYYIHPEQTNNISVVSMLSNKQWTFDQFTANISEYKSGWITWETRKGYHIRSDIRKYISENFIKVHGDGIDDTKVEVYFFNITDSDDKAQ